MNITVSNQLFIFVSSALCGIVIGLIFDVFRIFRQLVRASKTAAIIEDITYWLIAAGVFFVFVIKVNNGELRLYQFIGVFIGTGLYFISVSKYVISISVCVIQFMVKMLTVVFKIILTPILFVFKLFRKPFFFIINVSKKGRWKLMHKFSSSISNFNKFLKKI